MLTAIQKLRIRARSGVAQETLKSYLVDRTKVRSISAERIEAAAREEGIVLPPVRSSTHPPTAA